ncbi:MAG: SpoIID/LytB domain-containing protein [Acidobacteria bacterium]|nr:SpoIID/LytB domain-containing protein [Acidobacteriota bacterium]
MHRKNRFPRWRQSLAFCAAVLISGCLQPLTGVAWASIHKTRSLTNTRKNSSSRPPKATAGLENKYGEKGPVVRVALLTDVTSVSLTSLTDLAVRRSSSDKALIVGGQLLAEARQPSTSTTPANSNHDSYIVPNASSYRVEVSALEDAAQAKKITESVKQKYDQTAAIVYNEQTGLYRVLTGKYSSKNQATDMVEILREAGYARARVVANPSAAPGLAVNQPPPLKKPAPLAAKAKAAKSAAYKTQPSVKKSITAPLSAKPVVPQLLAFDADRMIASDNKFIIISAVAATADAPHQPASYKTTHTLKTTAAKSGVKKSEVSKPNASIAARNDSLGSAAKPLTIHVDARDYRGEIQIALNDRGRLNVINLLPLEEYLRGVVPMELSPAAANIEALKAQAVAARSYALANLGRFKEEGFDLRDDQRSQVYGGFTAENSASNRAVEETRGIVALYFNEYGKAFPIEALYTADCGGRTENNENMFSTKAIAYLRSVDCPLDNNLPKGREILSSARIEPISEPFGHSLARNIALLQTCGFDLPDKVDNDYLRGAVEKGELQNWAETAANLTRPSAANALPTRYAASDAKFKEANNDGDYFDINHEIALLKAQKRDITKLPGFATLMALATYGENRASLFMTPSEVNYVLSGLGAEEVPKEARADLAMLIKDGILRLPGDGQIDVKAAIKRGHALETFSRALAFRAEAAALHLQTGIAIEANKNQLLITPSPEATRPGNRPVRLDANASTRPRRNQEPQLLEVEKEARLFRVLSDESYAVDRLGVRGNERVTYHVNHLGRIDFLEVEVAERDEARDQIADKSKWNEALSAEEVQRRLLRSRLDVGEIQDLVPVAYGASRRVIELEITGSERSLQLRGQQIRSALGLKDNPVVIEREHDARGRATRFFFNGSGHGHGVGMCQVGAMRLARQGQSYIGIMQKYYTGVSVQKIY